MSLEHRCLSRVMGNALRTILWSCSVNVLLLFVILTAHIEYFWDICSQNSFRTLHSSTWGRPISNQMQCSGERCSMWMLPSGSKSILRALWEWSCVMGNALRTVPWSCSVNVLFLFVILTVLTECVCTICSQNGYRTSHPGALGRPIRNQMQRSGECVLCERSQVVQRAFWKHYENGHVWWGMLWEQYLGAALWMFSFCL